MFRAVNNDTHIYIDIDRIKKLIQNIDESVKELYYNGKSFPCIEKNAKQLKAIVEMLKIECMDI